jgi:hypothetical protein
MQTGMVKPAEKPACHDQTAKGKDITQAEKQMSSRPARIICEAA